jgi:hypothetical protein
MPDAIRQYLNQETAKQQVIAPAGEHIVHDLMVCLQEGKRSFEILNTYKGIPFVFGAKLQHVESNIACFETTDAASITLESSKHALLLSDGVLEPVEARIVSFQVATGKLDLADFTYASAKVGNRMESRVEPADPLEVELSFNGSHTIGHLLDVSMGGIGVRVAKDLEKVCFPGNDLGLALSFPEGEVRLPGRIRRVSKMPGYLRLAIGFTRNVPEKAIILRYISHRWVEIRTEVQQAYRAATQPT